MFSFYVTHIFLLHGLQIRTHHNATLSNIESFGVLINALPAAEIRF
ncbi:MAG: hypothetical protein ACTH9E_21460 [Serratia proteamaculans]